MELPIINIYHIGFYQSRSAGSCFSVISVSRSLGGSISGLFTAFAFLGCSGKPFLIDLDISGSFHKRIRPSCCPPSSKRSFWVWSVPFTIAPFLIRIRSEALISPLTEPSTTTSSAVMVPLKDVFSSRNMKLSATPINYNADVSVSALTLYPLQQPTYLRYPYRYPPAILQRISWKY